MIPRATFCFSLVAVWLCSVKAADLTLWYQQPAKDAMSEGLPIGNGRLGGLVLGEPDRERIVLDEDSIWTGDENPSGDYATMGAYQCLGDLFITLSGHTSFSDYRRDLNISKALAQVSYTAKSVHYQRDFFCSHPADVMVIRFTADKPAAYTGSIELLDSHGTETLVKGNESVFTGALTNGLAKAAKISLDARGITGDVREWSLALRCALYARLRDGEDAHKMVQDMFAKRDPKLDEYFTCPNLFGFYPPMQIDGDFGITSGICGMLLQSQDGDLDLLPALPPEWPTGSARGLQARGGFVVDETWGCGKLASATIHSTFGGSATVRYGKSVREF